jgi:hypothetical protein
MSKYFLLSSNHNDFSSLATYVIGKTFGYHDSYLNKTAITSPYNDWSCFIESTSDSESISSISNMSSWLSSLYSTVDDDNVEQFSTSLTGMLWQDKKSNSNAHYGDVHTQVGTDSSVSIDTTDYDKVVAVTDSKVIHLTWSDFSHSSFTTTFKDRCDIMDTDNNVSDWDERLNTYKLNLQAITYPTDDDSFVLYQDKLLDKDEAHYTALCTFLGQSELTSSTWKGYVDSYNTHLSS